MVKRGNAIARLVVGSAGKVLLFAEFDILADEQIQPPVIVVVEPHRARAPSGGGDAGLLRHIGKRPIAVIVIQDAPSILRHVHVGEAVTVVVAHRNALPVASSGNTRFLGDVGKGAVAIVAIKRIPQRRVGIVEVALSAVDEIDVHPPVIVVIQKRAACAGGLRQIFLGRFPSRVRPCNPAGGRWHFFERKRRCSQDVRDAAESGTSGGCGKRRQEVSTRPSQRVWCESGHCGCCCPCGLWEFGPPMRSVVCCCKANSRAASSLRPVREYAVAKP